MRSRPATRSILKRSVSSSICTSTEIYVRRAKIRWVVYEGKGIEKRGGKHTEDLIWFSKAKCEVVLLHQLAVLLGTFPAHLGRGGKLSGSRENVVRDRCDVSVAVAECLDSCEMRW